MQKRKRNTKYLKGTVRVHDRDFAAFCEEQNKTEDEVIEDMVYSGWTQGMDERGQFEYWEPADEEPNKSLTQKQKENKP